MPALCQSIRSLPSKSSRKITQTPAKGRAQTHKSNCRSTFLSSQHATSSPDFARHDPLAPADAAPTQRLLTDPAPTSSPVEAPDGRTASGRPSRLGSSTQLGQRPHPPPLDPARLPTDTTAARQPASLRSGLVWRGSKSECGDS